MGFINDLWEGNTTKLILRCNKHNTIWTSTTYNNFCKDHTIGCVECKGERTKEVHTISPEKALSIAETAQSNSSRANEKHYILDKILSSYTGYHNDVIIECPVHGEFKQKFSTIALGKGTCPECLRESRIVAKIGDESTILERIKCKIDNLKIRGYNIQFLGFVETNTTNLNKRHLKLYCSDHNRYWESTIYDNFIRTAGIFCPDCSSSKSKKISEKEKYCLCELNKHTLITDINTQYRIELDDESQKLLNNLSGVIIVDFYIKSINAIIEYNGGQHYEFIPYLQKYYSRYVNQVNRDLYLKKYCKENNIKLLIIPYVDDKRIPEIIEKFINNGIDITTKVEPKLLPAIVENNCRSLIVLNNGQV